MAETPNNLATIRLALERQLALDAANFSQLNGPQKLEYHKRVNQLLKLLEQEDRQREKRWRTNARFKRRYLKTKKAGR